MSDKDELIERATLAGHAERYDEMAAAMKNVVESGFELSSEDRNFFSVAYNNVVAGHRLSLRILSLCGAKQANVKDLIEMELTNVCNEVICLLNQLLITNRTNPESMVFLLKMKCDFCQYLADVAVDKDNESYLEAVENSVKAYEEALVIAINKLQPMNPVRLSLASVLFYEIEKKQRKRKPTNKIKTINQLPDEVLTQVLSYIPWMKRLKLELVSKKWRNILTQESMRKIDIDLDTLVKHTRNLLNTIESLVIGQFRIIEGFQMNELGYSEPYYNSGLVKLISLGVVSLKCLSVKYNSDTSIWNTVVQLINLSINLDVLCLNCYYGHQIEVDLSGLINLKQLIGECIEFINCRAPNLVKLEYSNVDVDDGDDFVQMLLVASDSIEHLHVENVKINDGLLSDQLIQMPKLTKLVLSNYSVKFIKCRAPNLVTLEYYSVDVDDGDDFIQILLAAADSIEDLYVSNVKIKNRLVNGQTITMPKLTKLKLSHNTNIYLTIDLVESKDLQSIITHGRDNDYGISNFSFAVHHCITYFHGSYNLSSQFIKSVKLYPEHLCLLKELCIHLSSDEFNDFINCLSTSYNYCFRRLTVTLKDESPLTDSVNIFNLVECSPDLRYLGLPCSIAKQCLIDLIVNKINCDHFRFYISSVSGCSEVKFLMDLYAALSGLDPRPVQSPDRSIFINCHLGGDHGNLTKVIYDEFGVKIW